MMLTKIFYIIIGKVDNKELLDDNSNTNGSIIILIG